MNKFTQLKVLILSCTWAITGSIWGIEVNNVVAIIIGALFFAIGNAFSVYIVMTEPKDENEEDK